MAGLEALTAMIYHERQQEGSMLCAQHALNSLLQGNYFTAPDLAAIAHSFDALEHDTFQRDEAQRSGSHNMDDTGFFSVQVMDKALDVWGLHLVRWRSEQMRPYQDSPHKLLAFVLNLQQHWFTLRRFGSARTTIESDPGEGHWFNLNSQYPAPKWVSRTYLGMFLRQSEEEGYSVFAVVQADTSKPLALPRTEADLAAATLDAPDSAPGHSSSSTSIPGTFPDTRETGEVVIPDEVDYDINSEDVELQAALAASLTGVDQSFGQHAYVPRAPVPAPALRQAPAPPEDSDEDMDVTELPRTATRVSSSMPEPLGEETGLDPVAASMARNQQMLERMRRMQEAALRETYEDETAGRLPDQQAAQNRRTREEEEQAELERAIAASMAEHSATTETGSALRGDDGDNDGDWLPEDVDKENVPTSASARRRVQARRSPSNPITPPIGSGIATSSGVRTETGEIHRVYDDEDQALQEALRASLQTMPEGFVHPPSPLPSRPVPAASSVPARSIRQDRSSSGTGIKPSLLKPEEPMDAEEAQGDEEEERASSPPPPAKVDLEEMRKRRLAKFSAASGSGSGSGADSGADSDSK